MEDSTIIVCSEVRGQLVIRLPVKQSRRHGWKKGDRLESIDLEDGIKLVKARAGALRANEQKVLDCLSSPLRVSKVADKCGISYMAARDTLCRLEGKGLVVKRGWAWKRA